MYSVLVEPASAWRPLVHAVPPPPPHPYHHSYAARPYRVDIPLSAEPPAIVDGLLVAQDVTLTLEMDSPAVATLSALEEAAGDQAGAASSVVDPSCAVGVRYLVAWRLVGCRCLPAFHRLCSDPFRCFRVTIVFFSPFFSST